MIEDPPKLILRKDFPRPTAAQVAAFRDVPTGFVCDAMNGTGAMDHTVRPLLPGSAHVAGVALVADNGPEEILATLGAMHIMEAGDIVVAATRGCTSAAAAGDLFMGMLRNKGGAGFVTDGVMRDYDGIVEVGLPAWCAGLSPNSPFINGPGKAGFGAVVAGQSVNSGDIIVADINGVVVVPFARIDAVIAQLEHIKKIEMELEERVRSGEVDTTRIADMLLDGTAVLLRDRDS